MMFFTLLSPNSVRNSFDFISKYFQDSMIFPGQNIANVDAETNTECVFIQQPVIGRKKSQGDILSRLGASSSSSSVKRSKTFSPSAPIAKSHYNCRVGSIKVKEN